MKEQINNGEILDFFRRRIASFSGNSAKEYSKAFAFLSNFIPDNSNTLVSPSIAVIETWCMYLFNSGMTKKTVVHYNDIISGLYRAAVAEGLVGATDVFKTVKAKIENSEAIKPARLLSEGDYDRLHNLAHVSRRLPKDVAVYIDIFIISILTGCRTVMEIAMMKKDNLATLPPQAAEIMERYCESNRKYVFPLSQSERTVRQLERELTASITDALSARGIRMFGSLIDTARSYWSFAAIKSGLTVSGVYSILGAYPKVFPVISASALSEPNVADKESAIKTVADTFLFNPHNWYAMRLRPRVTVEHIEKRFEILRDDVARPEIFYPSREIAKRIGKKTLFKKEPVIPDIVFFKSRVTDVYPMFLKIGDLAWCYRSGNGVGAYAAIPRGAMERFQRAIGHFTADYEVGPIGSITLRPGDTVRIIDGTFAGNEGELLKIMEAEEAGVIYRLRLIDDRGVEWRVRVDSRLTEACDSNKNL